MEEPKAIINPSDFVTVTEMGKIIEIMHMEKMNTRAHIRKISKTEYVELSTGEIKEFKPTVTRAEGKNSLGKTFKKLRNLVNNNFSGRKNELFVTLTFEPDPNKWRPMVGDTQYLAKACKEFQRKLRRKYGNVQFLRVLEPHADGHAHYHMLIRFDDFKHIFIPNEELNAMWGMGFVTIHSLKDVDNIGAYVSAYLTDIEFEEKTAINLMMSGEVVEVVEKEGKKYIKGGRLKYYPAGTQIYNKSKGILEPEKNRMSYKNAKKIVGSAKPHYTKIIDIENEDYKNTITYEQYNLKR